MHPQTRLERRQVAQTHRPMRRRNRPSWAFGEIYGDPNTPAYITPEGPVYMWRKRQRVRFLTADGRQVGAEQPNVAPAVVAAAAAGWIDPASPFLGLAFAAEMRSQISLK